MRNGTIRDDITGKEPTSWPAELSQLTQQGVDEEYSAALVNMEPITAELGGLSRESRSAFAIIRMGDEQRRR